jgi:hypothetical protein
MSDQVELKLLSSASFAQMITEEVRNSKDRITHLDAIEDFLERNEEVEPETIASLIQRNQKLKAVLYEEAEQLNLVKERNAKLPID